MPDHLLPGGRRARARRGRAHRARCRWSSSCEVDDILVGHSHFDHVKDLPLLADLIVGRRDDAGHHPRVARVRQDAAREHVQQRALAGLHPHPHARRTRCCSSSRSAPGAPSRSASTRCSSVPVSHPVESCGFVISNGNAVAGDERRHRPHREAVEGAQQDARTSRRCCWRPASPTSCRSWRTSPATSRRRRSQAELTQVPPQRRRGAALPPQARLRAPAQAGAGRTAGGGAGAGRHLRVLTERVVRGR